MQGKEKLGRISMVIESIGCVGLVVACILIGVKIYQFHQAENELVQEGQEVQTVITAVPEKKTTVVLYEGPKSMKDATEDDLKVAPENARDITLKHCVDTKIEVNGRESYVYDTNVNNSRSWSSAYTPSLGRTPITYFDFEGEVEIKVTVPEINLDTVTVSPLSYGITPKINKEEHTVTFYVTTPDTYTLTFNGMATRAVHIFANELEKEVLDVTDPNVIYIGPGEWDIGNIILKSGQTLYISGGAVVHGIVNVNFVDNVKVCGRGIIDGSYYPGWGGTSAYIPLKFDNCNNISVNGIVLLNPNAWVVQAYSTRNMTIDNIKIVSSRPNGDGISIQSCQDVMVMNSFVRSWDDSLVVKNYAENSSNIKFMNMQLWTDLAQSMEVGYETNKGKIENAEIRDVLFENITVLNNFHKPVISVHNADDALVTDIVFRNITIENAQMGSGDGNSMPYLIDLHIDASTNWSSTTERGQIRNITIENVDVLAGKFCTSRIKGYDAEHTISDVTIRNLNILGEQMKDFNTAKIEIDDKTTSNIIIE